MTCVTKESSYEDKHEEPKNKNIKLVPKALMCFYWYWTYFGRVDILHHEILLQGT